MEDLYDKVAHSTKFPERGWHYLTISSIKRCIVDEENLILAEACHVKQVCRLISKS